MPTIRQHSILDRKYIVLIFLLLLSTLLVACDLTTPTSSSNQTSNSPQQFTYSTSSHDVIIRTFYGGGAYGALELSPTISIYGDGTYILGGDLDLREGKLGTNTLQNLIDSLVNTYGLLNFSRQQFYDLQDTNVTLLELNLNGKHYELVYGKFGSSSTSTQDLDQYKRLEMALTNITNTLSGPTHTYTNDNVTLLARVDYSPDFTQTISYWPLSQFTLAKAALFVCGEIPQDITSPNAETGCMKYLIPLNAQLLTTQEVQRLNTWLDGKQQGDFIEFGIYYTVTLRPLLPDEIQSKSLAMFGSAQHSFRAVPINNGIIPEPSPTASA